MGKPCFCKICGRPMKDMRRRGMCEKHYRQFKKHGCCLDANPRTAFDLNEIVIQGDVAFISLYDCHQEKIAEAIIDTEDVPLVRYIKWKYRKDCGYVINTGTKADKRPIHLHRLVLGLDKGTYSDDTIVDHINHNPLDNRKENLRVVTRSENALNLTDVPLGVSLQGNKWYAYIKLRRHMYNLGVYVLKEEALYARWWAEKVLFGEFAYKKPEPFVSEERKQFIQSYINRKCRDYNNETGKAS